MNNDNPKKGGRAKARGQPQAAKPKKPRQRLPVNASLRLDDSLAANEHHPLAKTAPQTREASRLQLIANILARLAQATVGRAG